MTSSVKADVNMKTLIGRGSGETVQLSFSGQGWLLIQPSEGRVTSTGGGRQRRQRRRGGKPRQAARRLSRQRTR